VTGHGAASSLPGEAARERHAKSKIAQCAEVTRHDRNFRRVNCRRRLAGAVLANRLSEDGTRRIILLEAEPVHLPNLYPPGLANADMLSSYKAVENSPDGDDHYHGRHGPLPIRLRRPDELTASLNAFIDAAVNQGFARVADFNEAEQAGVGPYPLNVISGRRINTGIAFLNDGVRARQNRTIKGGVEVDRVLLDGTRCVGVIDASGNEYRADLVILSAGAFGSPAILMRSGVGPAEHLRELGIAVVADLPVGERLQEHPFYYNIYALKPGANGMHPAAGAILWAASSEAEADDLDLHVSATHLFDPNLSPTGGAIVRSRSPNRRGASG
jgi:choline dehydrogenase